MGVVPVRFISWLQSNHHAGLVVNTGQIIHVIFYDAGLLFEYMPAFISSILSK